MGRTDTGHLPPARRTSGVSQTRPPFRLTRSPSPYPQMTYYSTWPHKRSTGKTASFLFFTLLFDPNPIPSYSPPPLGPKPTCNKIPPENPKTPTPSPASQKPSSTSATSTPFSRAPRRSNCLAVRRVRI